MRIWEVLQALSENPARTFENEWGMEICFQNGILSYKTGKKQMYPLIIRQRTEDCPYEDLEYEWTETTPEPKGLNWDNVNE